MILNGIPKKGDVFLRVLDSLQFRAKYSIIIYLTY